MHPSAVCAQCGAVVPIRLKVCKSCQHLFKAKQLIEHTFPARAMKRFQVAFSECVKSVTKDFKNKVQRHEKESCEKSFHRQHYDREYKSNMRAAKSSEQTLRTQHQNKECMAKQLSVANKPSIDIKIKSARQALE